MDAKPYIASMVQETEAFEAFADIPQNRVLMPAKLTVEAPVKPEIVHDLTTVEQVFEHYKPKIQIEFETEEGTSQKETFSFSGLGNFGINGITAQSNFLNELTMKKNQYQKIIRQLKRNRLLAKALADKVSKENLLTALYALITELEEAK